MEVMHLFTLRIMRAPLVVELRAQESVNVARSVLFIIAKIPYRYFFVMYFLDISISVKCDV